MGDLTLRRRARARFVTISIGLLVVAAAGYVGFVAFATSGRPAVAGVMALAAATGFAAFFSPCSFPLLLTFLARRAEESRAKALSSALRVGAGAAALLAALGVVIAAGGMALASVVAFDTVNGRVFRALVGVALVLLGLRQAGLPGVRMTWLDRIAARASRTFDRSKASNAAVGDVVHGFGYLLAGFG